MQKKTIYFTPLLLLLSLPMAQAEIYKWVDEQGQVHYSEKPPKEKHPATEIRIRTYTPHAPLISPKQRKQQRDNLLRAFQEERQIRNEAKEKKEQKEAKNRNNCMHARDRLKNFERANVLYDLDEQGERVYLSDAQRKRAEDNLRAQINKWCE
ncbi:hypothetical protein MNBD_GAMMA25-1512 [hydrothermal vent metagenome]|uniref:DUF4124 domain-containing protein n=1 Tax=hydrothermal vent metagenome TaxID=652676 RepID=A0A3B1B4K2_9ZZZZ